jgi:hypothetical protein
LVELATYKKYERKLLGEHSWDLIFKKLVSSRTKGGTIAHKIYNTLEFSNWMKLGVVLVSTNVASRITMKLRSWVSSFYIPLCKSNATVLRLEED